MVLFKNKIRFFEEDHEKCRSISTFHILKIFLGDFNSLQILRVSIILYRTCKLKTIFDKVKVSNCERKRRLNLSYPCIYFL